MNIKKFCPCKINLMLAITGVRDDGFHNLISLVAPTRFGDWLSAELLPDDATKDELTCNMPDVPCDESNYLEIQQALINFLNSTFKNTFQLELV